MEQRGLSHTAWGQAESKKSKKMIYPPVVPPKWPTFITMCTPWRQVRYVFINGLIHDPITMKNPPSVKNILTLELLRDTSFPYHDSIKHVIFHKTNSV